MLSALVALLLAAVGPAAGVLLVQEDFAYAVGELNGQAGGSGFSGAWTATVGPTEVIDPGTAVSYAIPGGAVVDGGNRALLVEGTSNGDNILFRSLASPISSDEIYVGFLFQARTGTIADNDFAVFWHDSAATGAHNGVPNLGVKGNEGGGASNDFVARINLAGPAAYSTNITVGQTYYLVGRLAKSSPGAANFFDVFDLWVDPAAVDPTPDATSAFTGSLASFSVLGMRSANLDASDDFLFDAIRYATTWQEVVPVPEPSTGVLFALGLAVLAARGRGPRRSAPG